MLSRHSDQLSCSGLINRECVSQFFDFRFHFFNSGRIIWIVEYVSNQVTDLDGFRFFETVTPYKAGDSFVTQKIWYGDRSSIDLGFNADTAITINRGQAKNLKANFELTKPLTAPIAKGEVVGNVYFQLNGKDIAQFPLVTLQEINEGSWFSRLMDYFQQKFDSWFS